MVESSTQELLQKLQAEKDWHKSAIFTDKFEIITAHKCPLLPDELKYSILYLSYDYRFYTQAFNDRDTTVGEGFFINNEHFDVHRFHPPLVYGRRGGPDDGEGIALCRVKPKNPVNGETYWFILITYLLPILSAKAVPQMVKFAENYRKHSSYILQ